MEEANKLSENLSNTKRTLPEVSDKYELTLEEERGLYQELQKNRYTPLLNAKIAQLIEAGYSVDESTRIAKEELILESIEIPDDIFMVECEKFKRQKESRVLTNEYLKKINGPIEEKREFDITKYSMSVVHFIFKEVGLSMEESVFDQNFDIIFTPEYRKLFVQLKKYFTGVKCDLNPDKGIALMGNIGNGKTTLMKAFANNPIQKYNVVPARTIVDQYDIEGKVAVLRFSGPQKNKFFKDETIGFCFDDVGLEEKGKYYGKPANVMEEVFLNLYDKKGSINFNTSHLTTNDTPEELQVKFDPRVIDRMKDMYNFVALNETSKRGRV
jgi:DNA replication protein DnaC